MKKKYILLATGVMLLATPALHSGMTAFAFGQSPAFQKGDNISEEKLQELIVRDVKNKVLAVAPAMKASYPDTAIGKVLSTNYAKIDYPSVVEGTKEGIDDDGNLVLSALKKPITEKSKIQLAELVRFYQYNLSSDMSFVPMKSENGVVNEKTDDVESKLNYFDYVKLIDAIADNSNYSKDEKVKRLNQVEKDLKGSISILYGDSNSALRLDGWGGAKKITVPFKRDKFSYKQLLAAYEKNEAVIATLDYYSSILDTLEAIRNYSVELRHGRPASIDQVALAENVNNKYNKLSEVLIQPVADIYAIQLDKEEKIKAGQDEETKTLQEQGVVKEESKQVENSQSTQPETESSQTPESEGSN